jgi:hypothetical protein
VSARACWACAWLSSCDHAPGFLDEPNVVVAVVLLPLFARSTLSICSYGAQRNMRTVGTADAEQRGLSCAQLCHLYVQSFFFFSLRTVLPIFNPCVWLLSDWGVSKRNLHGYIHTQGVRKDSANNEFGVK